MKYFSRLMVGVIAGVALMGTLGEGQAQVVWTAHVEAVSGETIDLRFETSGSLLDLSSPGTFVVGDLLSVSTSEFAVDFDPTTLTIRPPGGVGNYTLFWDGNEVTQVADDSNTYGPQWGGELGSLATVLFRKGISPEAGFVLNNNGSTLSILDNPAAAFVSVVPVPEPGEWVFGVAMALLGFVGVRRRSLSLSQ